MTLRLKSTRTSITLERVQMRDGILSFVRDQASGVPEKNDPVVVVDSDGTEWYGCVVDVMLLAGTKTYLVDVSLS